MVGDNKGRDLFIVDNSISGWTGLRYLQEWCGIARAFDIATGYFEIGALLALDSHWQPLERIRILMGAETNHRSRKALLEAVCSKVEQVLDASIESDKQANPFLRGVPGIVEALQSRQIECRVYDRDKFHAKAYITHAKLEVVGSQALVGSSNFTGAGLTKNDRRRRPMITPGQIRRAVDCLAHAARPERILLFGSYAPGNAREDSDLDLLVIESEVADRAAEMVRLRRILRPLRIPADILVYSLDDVARWGDQPGSALFWALREGRTVYA